MPILMDDTHDRAEREGESFAREQARMTDKLHEPRGEFVPAVDPLYAAKQRLNGWLYDLSGFDRTIAELFENARLRRGWKDPRGYHAGRADIEEAAAKALCELREKFRAGANEAKKALCALQGVEFVLFTWEK